MTAKRQPGKINDATTLIDLGMYGVAGVTALYLIQGDRKCLIDGGTRTEASRLVKSLKALDAFPPDIVIATHAHYDHTQGIPILRREAAKQGRRIEVVASHAAVPLLEDATYNDPFEAGPYERIVDVKPVREGDTVDLGGISLRFYEVPGHCRGHVAALDEKHECLFVGDAIGYKVGDRSFLPPFMPPTWDPDEFLCSVDKLKQVNYQSLCLAHYGYIYGDEARSILDEAVSTYEAWWGVFDRNKDRLDDTEHMVAAILQDIKAEIPDLKISSLKLKTLFGLLTAWKKVTRQRPQPVGELLLGKTLGQLAVGYRLYNKL